MFLDFEGFILPFKKWFNFVKMVIFLPFSKQKGTLACTLEILIKLITNIKQKRLA